MFRVYSNAGLAAANVLSFLGAAVTVFETHNRDFALRGGGLGADLTTLKDIRQCDAAPPSRADGVFFYGDLWKVHQHSSLIFCCL